MKNNLFGEKVSYENFAPPYVLIALMSRFVNRYQSAANAVFKELSWQQMFFSQWCDSFQRGSFHKRYG